MFARYGKIMMHVVHGRQAEAAIDAPKNRQAIFIQPENPAISGSVTSHHDEM
jgi:hypothetical protein